MEEDYYSSSASFEETPGRRRVLSGRNTYQCSTCPKYYLNRNSLMRHVRYQCNVTPKFECHICTSKFPHNFSLKKHYKSVHNMDY
jgi:hypothetical protein